MKKISLLYGLLIFLTFSCSKEDDVPENNGVNANGKYVSEIISFEVEGINVTDTFSIAKFEYDENKRLKSYHLHYLSDQLADYHNEYFYNSLGQVERIEIKNVDNNPVLQVNFTYVNQKLVLSETYAYNYGTKILSEKIVYTTNSSGYITGMRNYFMEGNVWVESSEKVAMEVDSKGNITKLHYSGIDEEYMNEYKYDNKINPFASLKIPYSRLSLPCVNFVDYLGTNNITSVKSTIFKYYNQPVTSPTSKKIYYMYESNYPVKRENMIFYRYVEL